jgi:hypothetical protein
VASDAVLLARRRINSQLIPSATLLIRSLNPGFSVKRRSTSTSSSELEFEIGHVLFIDIVGYTKLLTNDQHAVEQLSEVVRNWDEFKQAEASDIGAYLLSRSFPGWNWGQWNGQFQCRYRCVDLLQSAILPGRRKRTSLPASICRGGDPLRFPAALRSFMRIRYATGPDPCQFLLPAAGACLRRDSWESLKCAPNACL